MKTFKQFSDMAHNDDLFSNVIGQFWNNMNGTTATQNYQAQREDTAYQRAVEDMQKAGLNPALMFGGGGAENSATFGGGNSGPLGVMSNLISNAVAMKNANTNRLREIDTNKHLTNKEKNDMERAIMQNEAFRDRTEAMASASAFGKRKGSYSITQLQDIFSQK